MRLCVICVFLQAWICAVAQANENLLVSNAVVLDVTSGQPFEANSILIQGGIIEEVGRDLDAPIDTPILNVDGATVIPPQFVSAMSFSEGLARAWEEGSWGYINTQGDWQIEPGYEWAYDFRQGLAAVQKDGKMGFIGHPGRFVIQPTYDWAIGFHDGLAAVNISGRWGFVDPKGQVVVEPAYAKSSNFNGPHVDGMAFGGTGWIIEPEAGHILGLTSDKHPFLTIDIDLSLAERAKQSYPRYVPD